MLNSFRCVALIGVLALWPGFAAAQDCDAIYEAIVDLSYPDFGSYTVWDAHQGDKTQIERFVVGTGSNKGANAVVIGERQPREDGKITLLLSEIDRRGRPVWEATHEVKDLVSVVKILPRKGGYLVIANQAESKTKTRVWLGFFSEEGKFIREKFVRDNNFSLSGNDIVESEDKKNYVLVATAQRMGAGGGAGYAILYWLDKEGVAKSDKAYLPGLENRALGITTTAENGYIISGYMAGEDGRKTGWVMRTDFEGNIKWQRQYPRGLAARLIEVDRYIDPYILVSGESNPSDGGKRAAWLMLLDGNSGEIGWQRFYRSTFDLSPRRLITHSDNQISFLLNATDAPPPKVKEETGLEQKFFEHVRLLTLSPRGTILISDPYFQGEGASAGDLFLGPNGERIVAGSAMISYTTENNAVQGPAVEAGVVELSRDGWVVAGAPAEPYKDPCVKPYSFFP